MRWLIGALGTALLIATAGCGGSTTKTVTVASTVAAPASPTTGTLSGNTPIVTTANQDPVPDSSSSPSPSYTVADVARVLDEAGATWTVTKRAGEDISGVYSVNGSCDVIKIDALKRGELSGTEAYVCDAAVVRPPYSICLCKKAEQSKVKEAGGVFSFAAQSPDTTTTFVRRFGANVYLRTFGLTDEPPRTFRVLSARMAATLAANVTTD